MSKSAAILGLAAIASASASAPAAYPAYSSSAPSYEPSSSAPVGPASSSVPSYPQGSSSSAPVYNPSSFSYLPSSAPSVYASSSYPAYPVPSSSYSVYPSSSSGSPVSSSIFPSGTPTPTCWATCFEEAGITSESQLCGNTEVDKCIHDGCCKDEAWAYWTWYDSFCGVPSSSYVIPSSTVPVGPVSSSSYPPSSTPTVECWGKCFAENDITSESELCGNTAVDECISETCSCEEDKAYWQWYESYCTATTSSSSASPTTPTVPTSSASSTPEDCWGQCFEEAGIASESELCGNTAVDACIHDTCSPAEDKAYWEWYMSYCPVETPVTTPVVTSTTTPSSPTSSSPIDSCWSDCFAEFGVTSEASLCGDDDVSKCIHDTCSAPLDKAYWEWYNSFCAPCTTGVVTITSEYTPSASPYSPVESTYVSTPYTPVESSPATGLPQPPASPVAPYASYGAPSYSAGATGVAQPTGYGAASSSWAPVPATGAGADNKPGFFLAAAMALAAFI